MAHADGLTHGGLSTRLTSVPERRPRGSVTFLCLEKVYLAQGRGEDTEEGWRRNFLHVIIRSFMINKALLFL
jgi:hypothetical protein